MDKDNKILKIIILILTIILIIIIVYIFANLNNTTAYEEKVINEEPYNEIQYENIIGSKVVLANNLDLQSIFMDNNHDSNFVLFHNNKIYYIYEPTACYEARSDRLDLEERIKNCEKEQAQKCTSEWRYDCEKDYCTNYYNDLNDILGIELSEKLPLCKEFDPDDTLSLKDLSYKYVLSQNIDGTSFQKIATYPLNDKIMFNYLTNNNIYFSNNSTINSLNINTFNINEITDNMNLNNLLSNQDFIFFDNKINNKYLIYKYDLHNDILEKDLNILSYNLLVRDKYTNDLYSYTSKLNIYKNGKVIYQLHNNETIKEVFPSYYNLYILVNNKLIKIKKNDYSFSEDININDLKINKANYLFIDSNSLIYLLINDQDIYTYNENIKEFKKIYSINSDYQIYHNFILTFNTNNINIYNFITKEELNINNVLYYYLNEIENRLYIVSNIDNNIEISYYDIK